MSKYSWGARDDDTFGWASFLNQELGQDCSLLVPYGEEGGVTCYYYPMQEKKIFVEVSVEDGRTCGKVFKLNGKLDKVILFPNSRQTKRIFNSEEEWHNFKLLG